MKKIWLVTQYLYKQFIVRNCPARAAGLSYATLLSLVPFMMISFAVMSLVPAFQGMGKVLQKFVLANFVATSANVMAAQLSQFLQQLKILSWYNLVFLAFVCVLMIYNMVNAFNDIWQVKMRRHFAASFAIYLCILLITPLLFGLLVAVLSYAATLPLLAGLKSTTVIRTPLSIALPRVVAFLVFSSFNWMLPSTRVKFWHAVLAGAITTILFEIAKIIFVLYFKLVPTYRIIYGALATIPIFLIWMYISWLIILFGALVCNTFATYNSSFNLKN